jgi:hypothetical protein
MKSWGGNENSPDPKTIFKGYDDMDGHRAGGGECARNALSRNVIITPHVHQSCAEIRVAYRQSVLLQARERLNRYVICTFST